MLLVRTKISANGVTGLMIVAGWCIAGSLLIPGIWGAVLAVFFSQVQMYIDCCDGEVARWRGTSGAKGVFLDKVGHYTTEGLVAVALGVRAVGEWNNLIDDPAGTYPFLLAGTVLAGLVLLNKALNDMVHVSRAFNGLGKLPDSKRSDRAQPWSSRCSQTRRTVCSVPPDLPLCRNVAHGPAVEHRHRDRSDGRRRAAVR